MLQKPEDVSQEQFLEDVKKLKLKFPVARISQETGFSKSNVSRYLSGDMEPSTNFLKAFYDKFPESNKKVPYGTSNGIAANNEQDAVINMLLLEIAKLKSKVLGISVTDAIDELEQNAKIALRQIEKGL